MSLFNTQPQYGYYQQPNPVQQLQSSFDQFGRDMNRAFNPNPTIGQQISYAVDDFTRTVKRVFNPNPTPYDQFQSSVNQFGRNMNNALYGEPQYSVGRLSSWGVGALGAWSACANAMARSGGPGGFMTLAIIGGGAFLGNLAYDYYLTHIKYRM
jgi:hypothetical protein